MRQLMRVFAVALLVSAVWASTANAAASWFKCTVELAGVPSSDVVLIRVTDLAAVPAFTSEHFFATSANVNQMLAIALTAMSTKQPALIFADPDLTPSTFFQIYLMEE